MVKVKLLIHYKPAYREETYCGLNPLQEQAQGKVCKFSDKRSKVTCEDCKGLPKT
jgi:hypothetical protein